MTKSPHADKYDAGLLLEGFVPFERELSQLAVRGRDGVMVFYPLVENHHAEGMLRLSLAPAPNLTPALEQLARAYATRVLQALNYVGVLAIEFFQQGEQLIANEMRRAFTTPATGPSRERRQVSSRTICVPSSVCPWE